MSHILCGLLAFPSLTVNICYSSSANNSPCFTSALVPAVYNDNRAHLSSFAVRSSLSSYPTIPSPSVRPAPLNMPRERPRMGCRRGSARGRAIRQCSSTSSEPTSDVSEFSSFNYPATCSGRGRGRGPDRANVCEHHSHLHTTLFRIPCSLGNASFIVFVAIELIKNAVGSGEALQEAPLEQRRANQNNLQPMNTEGQQARYTCVNAGPGPPARDVPSTSAAHPSDSKDSDQFGC